MSVADDLGDPRGTPSPVPPLPRLFSEAPPLAGSGGGGGDEGIGEAEPRVTGAPAGPGGAPGDFSLRDLVDAARRTLPLRRGRMRVHAAEILRTQFTPEQRLLILDSWLRSKLPARDFAPLVGISKYTLRKWQQHFDEQGPAGLDDKPRGRPSGSRLSEPTRRAILLLKQQHPDWGEDRISAALMRTIGFQASPGAVGRALEEQGYEVVERTVPVHEPKPQRFERARPNQLWQTDLFTFVLKRENRRVHLVAYLDDHSRFVVGYGLHASASGALVREVLEAGIANFGAPEEVLTDNGPQFQTWRGKSEFSKLLERRGIRQIVARPRHPQTLGKIERFWGTLWRECVQTAIFRGLDDARRRIGLFIDHYNFQRPHSAHEGLVPADRYFAAAPQVLATLKERVAANSAELARDGLPRKSFYLTGRVGDQQISLHAEGEKVVLTQADGTREEVDLGATGPRTGQEVETPPVTAQGRVPDHPAVQDEREFGPGGSPLDELDEELPS